MSRGVRRRARERQLTIFQRGGRRSKAGRKPVGEFPLASHARRARLTGREPLHVTTHLCAGLPSLRQPSVLEVLQRAFAAGAERFGFRLVQYSLQSNHLHFLVEAQDERALSRGVKGLLVRVARALNRHWNRKGRVVSDRYHARVLKTPRQVRDALVYVLQNARGHGCRVDCVDPYSSATWFDGWEIPPARSSHHVLGTAPGTVRAQTWLLRFGWRKHGEIDLREVPAERRSRP